MDDMEVYLILIIKDDSDTTRKKITRVQVQKFVENKFMENLGWE